MENSDGFNPAAEGSAPAIPATPSVDDMIAASHTTPSSDSSAGPLRLKITGSGSAQPNNNTTEPKRRGRPAGSGAQTTGKGPVKKKAEIVKENADLQAQLDAERARSDKAVIAELEAFAGMLYDLSTRYAAARRGPHWAGNVDERKNFVETGALAAAPYESKIRAHGPIVAFIAVVGTGLYVRIQQDREILAAWEANQKLKGGNANGDANAAATGGNVPNVASG